MGFWTGYFIGQATTPDSKPDPVLGIVLLASGGTNPSKTGFNEKANPVKYTALPIKGIESDSKDPGKTVVRVIPPHTFGSPYSMTLNMSPVEFFQTLQRQNGYVQVNQTGKNDYNFVPYAAPAGTAPSMPTSNLKQ